MNRGAMTKPLACAIAASLLLAACGNSTDAPPPEPPLAGASIGGPFTLTDTAGKSVSWSDFAGKYRVVYFGYAYCPDVCPMDVQRIMKGYELFRASEPEMAAQVQPIFITVDPERDTPKLLKGYVENFGPTFIGLTGTPQQIADVARAYRVYFQKVPGKDGGPYLMDHSSIVYLLDRNGRFVTHFTHEAKAEQIAAGVQRLL